MRIETKTLLEQFQVRKTQRQKEAFWAWLCPLLRENGYEPEIKLAKGLIKSYNIVVGNPKLADVIFTAHYDTCAVLPFPNFVTPRNPLWSLLYSFLICQPLILCTTWVEVAVTRLSHSALLGLLCGEAPLIFFLLWVLGSGKANKHTANDNTSGVATLLEILLTLPEELRDKVCIVFFDNEEKGLFGSGGFAKQHRAVKKNTLLINFDCVSDGDSLQLYPNDAFEKEEETLVRLEKAFLPCDGKQVEVVRNFSRYPSDQRKFERGVGVCALRKSRLFGWYINRIHTARDTVFDEKNIELLRTGAIRLLSNTADLKNSPPQKKESFALRGE